MRAQSAPPQQQQSGYSSLGPLSDYTEASRVAKQILRASLASSLCNNCDASLPLAKMQSPPPLPRNPGRRPWWIIPFVVVFLGAGLVLFVVYAKTVFVEVKSEIREQTTNTKVRINLIRIMAMAEKYFTAFPDKETVTMKELRAWRPTRMTIETIAGENYDGLVVAKNKPTISIALPNGQNVEYSK